jgi:acetyl-CoA synthetase
MDRHGVGSVGDLVQRAAGDVAWFWDAVVKDLELEWFQPYTQVVDLSAGIEWPRWFIGGKYNYVHDALDKQALRLRPDAPAVIWEGEDGEVRTLTYAELYAEVNRAANALKSLGVGKGDRVGIFMPMLPETVVSTLAVSRIGAIFIPIFSGYGGSAVASRLNDCGATLLITADGFYRAGKVVPMKAAADEAATLCSALKHILVVSRVPKVQSSKFKVPRGNQDTLNLEPGTLNMKAGRDLWWHELLASQGDLCPIEHTDAQDPYMIIHTSGTTGKPKGVVHTHAGFPIKAAQELAHCFDLHAGERIFWLSDLGWMMGPWSIAGTLILGATLVLYEGSIAHPRPDRIWDMVEQHGITHLGISPTAVRSLMAHGDDLPRAHNLSSLVVLAGAGEPWNPAPWRWLFDVVGGGTRPIINYSGGTEVSGGILACNTLLPLKPCAFSAPVPGMAPDIIDSQGRPVRGSVGELALRQPWVGITQGFWGDPHRYIEIYWSRIPGVWVHGDWARVDEDGFWYIQGRSDDTIKVAGKRVGPAEVESAAVSHPDVAEAAAIGVPDALKGEALVLFVTLRAGKVESETLRVGIESAIVQALGKTLKPQAVLFVKELPHTRNGKILRRLVRSSYLGEPAGDVSALENPAALEAIIRNPMRRDAADRMDGMLEGQG